MRSLSGSLAHLSQWHSTVCAITSILPVMAWQDTSICTRAEGKPACKYNQD